jgi:transcriptional regulator with XRE-family HTH domain
MDAMRLGAAIRAVRRRKGWRQVDLAEAAGADLDLSVGAVACPAFKTVNRA